MNKTFHFLAGLPRTGSTLLTAILNQNPSIYASPQSDLLEMMYLLDQNIPTFESHRAGLRHEAYDRTLRSLGETFYSDRAEPVVVDWSRAWGMPYNLNLAALLNPDVRIIATVRPVIEILASFIVQLRANPGNKFDTDMNQAGFFAAQYRDIDDARCDWLMRPGGIIDAAIFSVNQARVHPSWFHLVSYDHLVTDPARTLGDIYSFLGMDVYKHDFDHVQEADTYDDESAFGMPDLHQVRRRVARQSPRPDDVLSRYVLNKYADADGVLPPF